MSLTKPYYRIARPKAYMPNYVVDTRYAADRLQLSRAYCNIERELRNIFDYIEPDENNKLVFSFELYSLLLRACTEVELNCKQIMEANGAKPSRNYFTMIDYMKIEKSSKLSKYKVIYNNWRQNNSGKIEHVKKEMCSFANFGNTKQSSPSWYQAYNEVKHNRESNLEKANLENCMNAIAGILVLLYSQFGSQCIESYGINGLCWNEIGDYDVEFDADVIFEIVPPTINDWKDEELYDFEWDKIKMQKNPFEKFVF